ncbi:uncharacterized protein LOC143295160 [Babylonia areolata]|uniref:uncharacterized protein LOC143295160 n=1 Tax=Babylonia areolata TaxID=304850 RepID=UPI003FD27639
MASGGLMTHPPDVRSLTMKSDKLTVQGTGITPRAGSPSSVGVTGTGMGTGTGTGPLHPAPALASNSLHAPAGPAPPDTASRSSVASDEDVTQSVEDEEADSMLQGVVSMNKILEGQIEALRLRLQVEEKQHRDDKNKLRQEKDTVIRSKESEIDDLRESLVNREERIHTLLRASQEKDLTIQDKVSEIEELKKMVRQTEDYAHKLHRQIGQVKHKKEALETDALYKEQNSEISRLGQELVELKKRLGAMEQELQRATKIMEQQTARIRQLEEERGSMHNKFKEELDKATKAMRQEVERMREVMRQNYEEMRQLREQNRQMHSDVRDIKNMLMKTRAATPRHGEYPHGQGTGVQRPLTASPMNLLPMGSKSPVPPRGNPGLRSPSQGVAAANTARASRASGPGGGGATSGGDKVYAPVCGLKEGGSSALPSIGRQSTTLHARNKSAVATRAVTSTRGGGGGGGVRK